MQDSKKKPTLKFGVDRILGLVTDGTDSKTISALDRQKTAVQNLRENTEVPIHENIMKIEEFKLQCQKEFASRIAMERILYVATPKRKAAVLKASPQIIQREVNSDQSGIKVSEIQPFHVKTVGGEKEKSPVSSPDISVLTATEGIIKIRHYF